MKCLELKAEFKIADDLNLVCIADSVSDQYVTEYKTTSRPDANTYNALQLSLQHRLYAMVFSKLPCCPAPRGHEVFHQGAAQGRE